jgi:parallel beta-helix repeat protein
VSTPPARFADLQRAVDAAADGATITVGGTCRGPIRIVGRRDLTIQGPAPAAGGCPAEGAAPGILRATVRGGSKVIGVRRSRNITIRYLNIVDGSGDGLQLREVEAGRATCNCLGRNAAGGLTVVAGRRNELRGNLVTANAGPGIRLRDAAENVVAGNAVRGNRDDGIALVGAHGNELARNTVEDNAADGIELDYADRNVLRENQVHGNGKDGLDLETANRNALVANEVRGNGRHPRRDSGIELRESYRNTVGQNVIRANADGLADRVRCEAGAKRNSGSNVGDGCP